MNEPSLAHDIEDLLNSVDDCLTTVNAITRRVGPEGSYPPDAFISLGQKLTEVGQAELGHWVAAEILSRCAQDPDQVWLAHLLKASLYYQAADGPNMLASLTEAVQVMKSRGNSLGIGMALNWAGHACSLANARLLSALFYKADSDLYLDLGDVSSAAEAHLQAGVAYLNAAYFQVAADYFSQANRMAAYAGRADLQSEANRLSQRAASSLQEFQKEFSKERLENVLASEEGVLFKNPLQVAGVGDSSMITVRDWALAFSYLDDSAYAAHERDYLEAALRFFNTVEEYEGAVFCRFQLADLDYSSGEYDHAEKALKDLLGTLPSLGDHLWAEAAMFERLGALLVETGKFRDALEYNLTAADRNLQAGDPEAEAMAVMNVGVSLHHLGEDRLAIDYYQKALDMAEQHKEKVYTNLGNAYLALGEYPQAREYYKKALEGFMIQGQFLSMARCYGNLALVAAAEGDLDEAIKYNNDALKSGKDFGEETIQIKCLLNVADLYRMQGEYAKAIAQAHEAQALAEHAGNLELLRKTHMVQARSHAAQDDLQAAYSHGQQALALAQLYGETIEEEFFKLNYSASLAEDYNFIAEMCIRLDKVEEAFNTLEAGKSQSLNELLGVTELNPTVPVDNAMRELLSEEAACLKKLREVRTGGIAGPLAKVAPGELAELRTRLKAIYAELEKIDPEYVFLRRREAVTFEDVRKLLEKRPSPTALIEYFVGEQGIFLFVIDAKGALHLERAAQNIERFDLLLENYKREVLQYSTDDFVMNTWQQLGAYLLDPAAKHLQPGNYIYLVPHSYLHFLPIHACLLGGDPLIRNYPVAYAPSGSALKFVLDRGRGKLETSVAFGLALDAQDEANLPTLDPKRQAQLTEQQAIFTREAQQVAAILGGEHWLGAEVTHQAVRKHCAGKDLVHFSCHGLFAGLAALDAGLKLYDGMLPAREVFNFKLQAELVTLSACQTGQNWLRAGDDLIGLTRAFLYAGAASLLVSLWPVNSVSTLEFMRDFYTRLKAGADKASALRQAQLQLMQKYQNPYFWAPFIIVGEWGT